LDKADIVCGAPIGDKPGAPFCRAPFCLKVLAGMCTVTHHAGKIKPSLCQPNHLYLKVTKDSVKRSTEVSIAPKEASCGLSSDGVTLDNTEFDDLQDNNHLAQWDADLQMCKSKDKAIACFLEFAKSAEIIRMEAAAELREMFDAVALGNGASGGEEEEYYEDEDLSLVPEFVSDDECRESLGKETMTLVKDLEGTLKMLTTRMGAQGEVIEALRDKLEGVE